MFVQCKMCSLCLFRGFLNVFRLPAKTILDGKLMTVSKKKKKKLKVRIAVSMNCALP